MKLAELHYDLPPELIAQHPVGQRDASRLLVLDRATGRIEHRLFREITEFLAPGDCLLLNDTRVIPARFHCRRATGGLIEGLFLHAERDTWRVLLKPSARVHAGEHLHFERHTAKLVIETRRERGEWSVHAEPALPPLDLLAAVGHTPLPPYIHRSDAAATDEVQDVERYQTVYAERPGAVAAPTAGLHFTAELLAELRNRGVRQLPATLHVGPGTFVPIKADDLAQHVMHSEWFELGAATAAALRETRGRGGRIVAVGTTSARVLESLAETGEAPEALAATSAWTDIFIYPPYRFRLVDRLITNFHLPGSTLLALVMAFASPELIRVAYQAAIAERYRFYSYGDAMLIL